MLVEKPSLCNKQIMVSEASAGCYRPLGGGDGCWLALNESLRLCAALSRQALASDAALHFPIAWAGVMRACPGSRTQHLCFNCMWYTEKALWVFSILIVISNSECLVG